MKRVVRLTESDLNRIVKRVLNEQIVALGASNPVRSRFDLSKGGNTPSGKRLPYPEDGVDAIDPIIGGSSERDKKSLVKDLFKILSNKPTYDLSSNIIRDKSSNNLITVKNLDDPNNEIIEYMNRLKESMKGIGGNEDVLKVLSELDSKQLATIIKYWKDFTGDNDSLYEWLDGEWGLSWDEIWHSIGDFKKKLGISKYKKIMSYE